MRLVLIRFFNGLRCNGLTHVKHIRVDFKTLVKHPRQKTVPWLFPQSLGETIQLQMPGSNAPPQTICCYHEP